MDEVRTKAISLHYYHPFFPLLLPFLWVVSFLPIINSLSIKNRPFQRVFFVFISFPLICIPHLNCRVFLQCSHLSSIKTKNDKMRHIVVDFDKLCLSFLLRKVIFFKRLAYKAVFLSIFAHLYYLNNIIDDER